MRRSPEPIENVRKLALRLTSQHFWFDQMKTLQRRPGFAGTAIDAMNSVPATGIQPGMV